MNEKENLFRRALRNLTVYWTRLKAQPGRLLEWLKGKKVVQWGISLYGWSPFLWQCVLVVLYRLALDFLYLTCLGPVYAYSGFTTDFSPLRWAISLLVVLAFTPAMVKLPKREASSSTLVFLLCLFYFIPLTCYYACHGTEPLFAVLALVYWTVMMLAQFRIPVLHLRPLHPKHAAALFNLLAAGSVLLVFYISGRYTHFRLTLDFINVYGTRAEAAAYAIPTILRYGLSMLNILLPLLILYYLLRRKWLAAAVLLVTGLFRFSIDTQKSFFFLLAAVLAGYALYRRWMLQWIPLGLTFGTGVCLALQGTNIGLQLMHTFYERMMYVPVNLANIYFTYFSDHIPNFFRNGFLGKIGFDEVYSIRIPRIVGEFMDCPKMGANNGLLGDVFANCPPLLGVVIMPIVLVLCFRLLDAVSRRIDSRVIIVLCLYYASSFMNSSWSTILLSNGFLLACAVLYLFPREREELNP